MPSTAHKSPRLAGPLAAAVVLSSHPAIAQPAPPQLNPVKIQIAPGQQSTADAAPSLPVSTDDQLQLARDRIAGLYTRLHLLTPLAERSALIIELLTDQQDHLRSLGLDLTERALLNAEPTDDAVATALTTLLSDPAPPIRARAASVLDSMALPASTQPLVDALTRETDPDAVAPLIRAAARRGAHIAAPDIVRWIERDSPARTPAIDAAADLLASGFTPDQTTRDRLLAAILPSLEQQAPPARAWELLARLERTEELTTLLRAEYTDRALAAAAALLPLPAHTRTITDAALERPHLAPLAALAIRTHNPTADGYRTLTPFLPSDPELRTATLDQFIRAMPPIERTAAAAREQDSVLKLKLLQFVENPTALDALPNPSATIATRLDLLIDTKDLEGALQSIQALPEHIDRAPFAPQRVRALLRLSRTDEASAASTDPSLAAVWIDELERTNHPARVTTLAIQIRALFDASLTLDQRARVDTLAPPPNAPDETTSE